MMTSLVESALSQWRLQKGAVKSKPWGTGLLLPNIEVNHTDDETSTIRLVESLLMGASKFSPDTQGDGPGPLKCFCAPTHQIFAKSAPQKARDRDKA